MKIEYLYVICLQAWWFVLFDIGLPYTRWITGFGVGGSMVLLFFAGKQKQKENSG